MAEMGRCGEAKIPVLRRTLPHTIQVPACPVKLHDFGFSEPTQVIVRFGEMKGAQKQEAWF